MNFKDYLPRYSEVSDKEYKYRFTVFTPVYNAESTIERTHNSLAKQTFTDFEWLVINDGSSDTTDLVMKELVKSSPLKINYINNSKNQHKMACFMQAVGIADGELFLTFDADDECYPNALEIFDNEYKNISENLKKDIIAVTGQCVDQHGGKIGTDFPESPYYSSPFHIRALDKVTGEKWGFTKTNALRGLEYSDDFISNGFMSEGIVWNLLGKEAGKTKYINKVLRIYHVGIENSISSNRKKIAIGLATNNISKFNLFYKGYALKAPIFFLKNMYFLLNASLSIDSGIKPYLRSIDSYIVKFALILFWPFRKLMKLK